MLGVKLSYFSSWTALHSYGNSRHVLLIDNRLSVLSDVLAFIGSLDYWNLMSISIRNHTTLHG